MSLLAPGLRALLAALLLSVFAGGRAAADRDAPVGRLAVDFAPAQSSPGWFGSALEELVGRELSRFHRVQLAEKIDAATCPGRRTRCLVDKYRTAGVQVVVLGELHQQKVVFDVYDTWTGARAFGGSFRALGLGKTALQREIGDLVRPIVQSGGLLDQRPTTDEELSASGLAVIPGSFFPSWCAAPPAPPGTSSAPPGTIAAPAGTIAAPAGTIAAPAGTIAAPPGTSRAKRTVPPGKNAKLPVRRDAAPRAEPAAPAPPEAPLDPRLISVSMIALMVWIVWPGLLALLLVGRRTLANRPRPASWTWSVILATALSLVLIASSSPAIRAALAAIALGCDPTTRNAVLLLFPLLGGLLWGQFVLVNASFIFAPIGGLQRIRHDALWPLLKSWLALSGLRATLLVLYAPILTLTIVLCRATALPPRMTFVLIVPSVGLVAYFWALSLVDNLSIFLDEKLVEGPASERNAWHHTIKRYFLGYVRRNGIEIDARLLERTLFLPSRLPHVISYGGGFARPRILVGAETRELALGELPEETEAPERTVNPEELPHGFLLPAMGARSKGGWLKRAEAADAKRRKLTLAAPRARGPSPRLLGESATLLGWIMPQTMDEGVPLISNNSEDYEVVRGLLTEHYAAFAKHGDDDEIDDTDPTQEDFLFGALLREMGAFSRGDSLAQTIGHSLALALPKASWPTRQLMRGVAALYQRFLAGPAASVADAYAALNQGLHHLIQYLYHLRTDNELLLTARADAPRLIRTSREILERLGKEGATAFDRHQFRATERNRLVWLSPFFFAPPIDRKRRLPVVGAMALALVAGGLIAVAVRDAIDYHPAYLERMSPPPEVAPKPKPGDAPDGRL